MSKQRSKPTPKLQSVSLTIYSAGYALIQGEYAISLTAGTNRLQLQNMPEELHQSSLEWDTFAGPSEITVGPIGFRRPNVNPAAQLEGSINKRVTVYYGGVQPSDQQPITGTLLNVSGSTALLRIEGDKVREVRNVQGFTYDEGLADWLSNTPSLLTTLDAEQKGDYTGVLVYRSGGFGWKTRYFWELNEEEGTANIKGSILLTNQSGATFKDAVLSVAAGDAGSVDVAGGAGLEAAMAPPRAAAMADARGGGMRQAEVQELGQIKFFDVPGQVTIEQGDNQKIPFFKADNVPVRTEYRVRAQHNWHYYGRPQEAQAARVLILKNSEEHIDKPLPGGSVEVMQRDNAGRLRQTGGGRMADLPRNDEASISTGDDFDVKVTRKVVAPVTETEVERLEATERNPGPRRKVTYVRECVVEVFNGKKKAVEVIIGEATGHGVNFAGEHGFETVHEGQHERKVTVAAGATETIRYTMKHSVVENLSQ